MQPLMTDRRMADYHYLLMDKINNYRDALTDKINELEFTEGIEYQKALDRSLTTESKTIVGAINEIDNQIHTISGTLSPGWNTIYLDSLYPIGWRFASSPCCYTEEGLIVDYLLRNTIISEETIKNNQNTFDIYVPVECNFSTSVTSSNEVAGIPIDYLILEYYYTGADGKDLDTVTGIENVDWPLSSRTVGYGHPSSITNNSSTLIRFGGDNTGGGASNASTRYYENVFFDINKIQEQLPNEDIEVILYGTWYSQIGNGNIHVSLKCYSGSTPTITAGSDKKITLSGSDLETTYTNEDLFACHIPTLRGATSNYKNTYTPILKITFKKTLKDGYKVISLTKLS